MKLIKALIYILLFVALSSCDLTKEEDKEPEKIKVDLSISNLTIGADENISFTFENKGTNAVKDSYVQLRLSNFNGYSEDFEGVYSYYEFINLQPGEFFTRTLSLEQAIKDGIWEYDTLANMIANPGNFLSHLNIGIYINAFIISKDEYEDTNTNNNFVYCDKYIDITKYKKPELKLGMTEESLVFKSIGDFKFSYNLSNAGLVAGNNPQLTVYISNDRILDDSDFILYKDLFNGPAKPGGGDHTLDGSDLYSYQNNVFLNPDDFDLLNNKIYIIFKYTCDDEEFYYDNNIYISERAQLKENFSIDEKDFTGRFLFRNPSAGGSGDAETFQVNEGSLINTYAVPVNFYLSNDNSLSNDDILVSVSSADDINSSESYEYISLARKYVSENSISLSSLNSNVYPIAVVDPDKVTNDPDRSNNVVICDRALDVLKFDPNIVDLRGSFVLPHEYNVLGNSNSLDVPVNFYFSNDGVLSNDDILVNKFDSYTNGIALEASIKSYITSNNVDTTSLNKVVSLIAVIDPENIIYEPNADNNTLTSEFSDDHPYEPYIITKYDVTCSDLKGSFNWDRDAIEVEGDNNIFASNVTFYLSNDNNISNDDVSIYINNISGNRIDFLSSISSYISSNNTSTTSLNEDVYCLVVLDSGNLVYDPDRSNNTVSTSRTFPLHKFDRRDLTLMFTNNDSLRFHVSGDWTDIGSAPIKIYLSNDRTLSNDDILGYVSSSFSEGHYYQLVKSYLQTNNISLDSLNEQFFVIAIIDPDSLTNDPNDSNNKESDVVLKSYLQ